MYYLGFFLHDKGCRARSRNRARIDTIRCEMLRERKNIKKREHKNEQDETEPVGPVSYLRDKLGPFEHAGYLESAGDRSVHIKLSFLSSREFCFRENVSIRIS